MIVEFAKELNERNNGLVESAIEASRMLLQPIIMTSMAFVLGGMITAILLGATILRDRVICWRAQQKDGHY